VSDFWNAPLQNGGPNSPSDPAAVEMAWRNLVEGRDYVVYQWDTRQDPDFKPRTFKNAKEERAFLWANGWRCAWYWLCRLPRFVRVYDEEAHKRRSVWYRGTLHVGPRWHPDEDSFRGRHLRYVRTEAVAYLLDVERGKANFAYRQRLRALDPAAYDAMYIDAHNVGFGEPRGTYGSTGI
jgi:hypothetical protein